MIVFEASFMETLVIAPTFPVFFFVVFVRLAGLVWLLQEEIERRNQSGTTLRPGSLAKRRQRANVAGWGREKPCTDFKKEEKT